MNEKRVEELIKILKKHGGQEFDYDAGFAEPFLEAVGDDREGLCKFLGGLSGEDLDWISGVLWRVREKWNDGKMIKFLNGLVDKLKAEGYYFSW